MNSPRIRWREFITRRLGIKSPITREEIYADDLLPHEKPEDQTPEDAPTER